MYLYRSGMAEAGLNYFLFYADSDNEENIQTAYHHQGNVVFLPDSVETRPVYGKMRCMYGSDYRNGSSIYHNVVIIHWT